jgi:membrane glycosyltransferase
MLFLDESSVLRSFATLVTALKWFGYALVVVLTYYGLRLLWRSVRRADQVLDWGATLRRWALGVLLLLPASWLLLLLLLQE